MLLEELTLLGAETAFSVSLVETEGPSAQSCDQGSQEEGGALPCRAVVCLLESQVFPSSGSAV